MLESLSGEILSFSTPDRAVRIQALPDVTVLCSWTGHLLLYVQVINGSESNLVETGLSACLTGKMQLMNTIQLSCVKCK